MSRFFHRHKDGKEHQGMEPQPQGASGPAGFTFVRTDTTSATVIHQTVQGDGKQQQESSSSAVRSRSASTASRLRQSFLGHHKKNSDPSLNIPVLPTITKPNNGNPEDEAKWEERATILAKGLASPTDLMPPGRSRAPSIAGQDDTIQEAIALHEKQKYGDATEMFKRLADPNGPNNPLSQVLYALSLRHGWGCQTDEGKAAEYLRLAASNAADVEQEALRAGMSKGGSAKGELILAIYELANCYRQGWGVPKDLAAAFQYYLTAANLGDTDAMNEVALCYLEGYGTKKDKFEAARYYRLAESKGNKIVGNSWYVGSQLVHTHIPIPGHWRLQANRKSASHFSPSQPVDEPVRMGQARYLVGYPLSEPSCWPPSGVLVPHLPRPENSAAMFQSN